MEIGAPVGGAGQFTVPAAQARLAELAVGQLYRVQVTDIYPGKVEILVGNQYLLAATNFKFQAGDVINLRLTERTPELLTFQLALPSGGVGGEAAARDLATLLRAASLADTPANRSALLTLVNAGVTVNPRTMGEITQLLATVPAEVVATFLPLYKELVDRELKPAAVVLEQLARLSSGDPGLAGLLSAAQAKLRRQRGSSRTGQDPLADAVAAALTTLDQEADLPTAQLLRDRLRLLYGSPERRLYQALTTPVAPGGPAPEGEPAGVTLELDDLANLALGEQVPAELALALDILQALRISASLDPAVTELALPLVLDGEPTEVLLSITVLAEQYYQKDYALRLRLANQTQGRVEIQLRTRGPGLFVDVLSSRPEVLAAYQEQFDRFRVEVDTGSAFFVRRVAATPHSV